MNTVIFNTHDVVLIITAYQCVLFAVLLLVSGRAQRNANIYLAMFLLAHAAIPADILINFGEEFRNVALEISPNLFYLFGFAYWLEGPLLLWYIRSALYRDYRPRPLEWLYLLPFVLYLIYELMFYYTLPDADKLALQQGYALETAPRYMNYVTFFRELMRVAFGVACIVEINRYRRQIRRHFSDIRLLDFEWLKILSYGFLFLRCIAVVVAVMILLSIHAGINVDFAFMGLTGNYLTLMLISLLIFFSLKYSTLLGAVDQDIAQSDSEDANPYSDEQVAKLLEVMQVDRPWLESDLTMEELSNRTGIPTRTLSAIMNRHFNRNFFEFINNYRLDEALSLLQDTKNKHLTILDILYESGFNSKATFNTLFKRREGMTPSEYRRKANIGQQPAIRPGFD